MAAFSFMQFSINNLQIKLIRRKNAKRVSLRIDNHGNISATVPFRYSGKDIDMVLASETGWIERKLDEISKISHPSFDLGENGIFYRGEVWKHVVSQCAPVVDEETRSIRGRKFSSGSLVRWYKSMASFLLPARARKLAQEHGFIYSKVSVREASRRWGSCRSDGSISLNSKLILTPYDVADAVILHELVHTEHLNHGKEFWARLHEFCPNWSEAREWLNTYHHFIDTVWKA